MVCGFCVFCTDWKIVFQTVYHRLLAHVLQLELFNDDDDHWLLRPLFYIHVSIDDCDDDVAFNLNSIPIHFNVDQVLYTFPEHVWSIYLEHQLIDSMEQYKKVVVVAAAYISKFTLKS